MIPGLANHSGYRNHTEGRNKEGWDRARVRHVSVDKVGRWLHHDAEEVKSE